MPDWLIPFLIVIYHSTLLSTPAIAQATQVPSASQQIAAAILPLPEVLREHATVLGYAADLSLITLREGTNGMVCTAPVLAMPSSMCAAITSRSCPSFVACANCIPMV